MKKILIINGPNLNMLGKREPDIYGDITLKAIEAKIKNLSQKVRVEVSFFQSNSEGEIITEIQKAQETFDGIIINPAGYSHTSIAIRDAIAAIKLPVIEVHISNIYAREDFRKHSYISEVCMGQIAGFGVDGYLFALIRLAHHNL
ncbi:MAG: type II 3-dehydroquinate dehydratase [Elusimicrobiota bacterium]|jgi:3-dehydroquinate dehydratase-2|nr:type II 3-dehydroquinate dehydratase [Elusimicrobiota bacterium]